MNPSSGLRAIGQLTAASLTAFTVAGCGGGGTGASTAATPVAPVSLTTNVSATVIDGPIKNAVVCLDKNSNGQCDADEIKGTTDASGNVTLAIPNADVGKYPILAVVGTDAVDADHGPVSVAYTMTAPADQTAVISPLTTLVQQTVASTGASTADAAKTVQSATSLSASLFQDYTKVAAPTDGSISAATVARMLVVTTQQQSAAVASALNSKTIDGTTISQADLDKAVKNKLLELLPSLITALSDPAVQAATGNAKETALLAAATTLVGSSGLSTASAATVVAVNKAADSTAPSNASLLGTNVTLTALNYYSPSSYYARQLTYSAAQSTPDASGMIKFVDRRLSNSGTSLAKWGLGSSPALFSADLHWNGKAWVGCPINFESTAKVRDANGNGGSNYCDQLFVDTSKRATFDISGKPMADVYAQARAAGYTNLFIADPSLLGSAVFPVGSSLFYQSNNTYSTAIRYSPVGANSPAGTSYVASQYSAAVAAGGNASAQAADAGCNSAEASKGAGISAVSLETWMAAWRGSPCTYPQGSLTYNGMTYQSDAVNEWWGNSTAYIDTVGTAPLTPSATTTGYYSGNTQLRLAFTGTGANAVTYYACKQRLYNGSPRNCTKIGEGTYVITTLGDARVLSLTNPPAAVAGLTYNKVWVERGGLVYIGSQAKPSVWTSARLNTVAATAFLTQLGVPVEDPEVPLALTAASYQGTWDFRKSTDPVSASIGTTVYVYPSGFVSCQDKVTGMYIGCTLTITDPATGAFDYTDVKGTASGSFNFMTATVSGTYSDSTTTPSTGSLVGGRR